MKADQTVLSNASDMTKTTIRKSVLDNGVRVITERMPFVRSVSLGVWIRVGSANESAETNGISHFLEHMLFKGTKKRTALEIASSLESLGGYINGSTGKEISVFNAHILDEHIETAIDVLTDLLLNPKFGKKELDLEKSVVMAEISHAKEDPEEMVLDLFCQNVFPDHPLGFFIYGTESNVNGFSQKALFSHLHDQYTCDRTVIAAAGNVEHERFVEMVAERYQPQYTSPASTASLPLTDHPQRYFKREEDFLHQAHICLGSRICGHNDERKFATVLLDVLLGGGMSSRLFQNIREKYGFAYSVYSFTDFMAEIGLLGIYMACAEDKVEKSIELMQTELKKLKKNSVSNEELSRIKSQVKGNIVLGLESSSRRMRHIGENESYNCEHLTLEQLITKVDNVTPGDLVEMARQFLDDSKLNITILAPK